MISIVLYVHDAERYLGEMLDSIFAQTFQDFEICAVDDGSTDGTGALLDSIDDPRLRVLHIPGNGRDGLHHTFNLCLAMCRHDLVAIANGDDVWRPDKLERQLAAFEADESLDVCFHDVSIMDADGRVTYMSTGRGLQLHPLDDVGGRAFILGDIVPNPTVMFRKEILRVIGAQETGWVHDYQFWMKAALAGCTFSNLPDRLVKYRVHQGGHSTSTERRRRIREESLAMVRWMLDRYTIADLFPELLRCEDGPVSLACAHWNLASLLHRGGFPDLADEQLRTARSLAPTRVGEGRFEDGSPGPRWFGAPPEVATHIARRAPAPPRVRLPAARTLLAVAGDTDAASLEVNLRLVLEDPAGSSPVLVLTDDDETTTLVARSYGRLVDELAVRREPQVELLQVRAGELQTVVQGNLLDGGTLLEVTGGPATAELMTTPFLRPVADAVGVSDR